MDSWEIAKRYSDWMNSPPELISRGVDYLKRNYLQPNLIQNPEDPEYLWNEIVKGGLEGSLNVGESLATPTNLILTLLGAGGEGLALRSANLARAGNFNRAAKLARAGGLARSGESASLGTMALEGGERAFHEEGEKKVNPLIQTALTGLGAVVAGRGGRSLLQTARRARDMGKFPSMALPPSPQVSDYVIKGPEEISLNDLGAEEAGRKVKLPLSWNESIDAEMFEPPPKNEMELIDPSGDIPIRTNNPAVKKAIIGLGRMLGLDEPSTRMNTPKIKSRKIGETTVGELTKLSDEELQIQKNDADVHYYDDPSDIISKDVKEAIDAEIQRRKTKATEEFVPEEQGIEETESPDDIMPTGFTRAHDDFFRRSNELDRKTREAMGIELSDSEIVAQLEAREKELFNKGAVNPSDDPDLAGFDPSKLTPEELSELKAIEDGLEQWTAANKHNQEINQQILAEASLKAMGELERRSTRTDQESLGESFNTNYLRDLDEAHDAANKGESIWTEMLRNAKGAKQSPRLEEMLRESGYKSTMPEWKPEWINDPIRNSSRRIVPIEKPEVTYFDPQEKYGRNTIEKIIDALRKRAEIRQAEANKPWSQPNSTAIMDRFDKEIYEPNYASMPGYDPWLLHNELSGRQLLEKLRPEVDATVNLFSEEEILNALNESGLKNADENMLRRVLAKQLNDISSIRAQARLAAETERIKVRDKAIDDFAQRPMTDADRDNAIAAVRKMTSRTALGAQPIPGSPRSIIERAALTAKNLGDFLSQAKTSGIKDVELDDILEGMNFPDRKNLGAKNASELIKLIETSRIKRQRPLVTPGDIKPKERGALGMPFKDYIKKVSKEELKKLKNDTDVKFYDLDPKDADYPLLEAQKKFIDDEIQHRASHPDDLDFVTPDTEEKSGVDKLADLIRGSHGPREQTELLYTQQKGPQAMKMKSDLERIQDPEEALKRARGELKGTLDKASFNPLRPDFSPDELQYFYETIRSHKGMDVWDKLHAYEALRQILDDKNTVPLQRAQIELLSEIFGGKLEKAFSGSASPMEKLIDFANVPRAMKSSFDLSAPLRQGLFFLNRVGQSGPAFVNMFRYAASEKNLKALHERIVNSPNADLYRRTGLSFTMPGREETFSSRLAEKIPGVRASGRGYSGFLNQLRADVFDSVVNRWMEKGITPDKAPKEYKALADYINMMTGRSKLPGSAENASQLLNTIFFAPKFSYSRLKTLNPITYVQMARHSPQVAKEAVRDLGTTIGMGVALLSLAKLKGLEVEDDPTSTDFAKIKNGNVRYDFWGGLQPWVRVMAQLSPGIGRRKTLKGGTVDLTSGKYGQDTRATVATRFARTKLAPGPGLLWDIADNWTDVTGKPVTWDSATINLFEPMFLNNLREVYKDDPTQLPFAGPTSFFGSNIQVIPEQEIKRKGRRVGAIH